MHYSLLALGLLGIKSSESTVYLPSTCEGLSDGYHSLKPMSDEDFAEYTGTSESAPVVDVMCNNGYMIIDPTHDINWKSYFSSWHQFEVPYAGPDLEDHVSWRNWFYPSRLQSEVAEKSGEDLALFTTTAEDCFTCTDSSTLMNGDASVFHQTGDSYGCLWPYHCPYYQQQDYSCMQCTSDVDSTINYGKCGWLEYSADETPYVEHNACTKRHTTIPSIGVLSDHCVCYKSTSSLIAHEGTIPEPHPASLVDSGDGNNAEALRARGEEPQVYQLYQSDFEIGTYRIMKPGTYLIMEDIVFNFQAGDLLNPNERGAWSVTDELADDYPGAGYWDGYYWLGMFAGITVEADDVVIDLQGHTLEMSYEFFIQQRIFVGICLSNKVFLDGRGNTFNGFDHYNPKNVVVRNGVVGLSSHAGILGANVDGVVLENLVVRQFETHGVLLNRYTDLKMKNVEVGPSVGFEKELRVNGRYNVARYMLPTFRAFVEDTDPSETISFEYEGRPNKGPFTVRELLNELVFQMDIAFHWAYFNEKKPGVTDEQFEQAFSMFNNEDGVSWWSTIYGLVLRPAGAAVFNFGQYDGNGHSEKAEIEDIYVHDLVVAPQEVYTLGSFMNGFAGPLELFDVISNQDVGLTKESQYVGNTLMDMLFGMKDKTQNWWYLGRLLMSDDMLEWAKSGKTLGDFDIAMSLKCNNDIGGHIPKGVVGMKIERSSNLKFKNVRVENLQNLGSLAGSHCGAWSDGTVSGMTEQNSQWMTGYYGTHARAINIFGVRKISMENVKISNIISLYGPALGIFVHHSEDGFPIIPDDGSAEAFEPSLNQLSGVQIDRVVGGLASEEAKESGYDLATFTGEPNWFPEGCAISCENSIKEADYGCSKSIASSDNIFAAEITSGVGGGCLVCTEEESSSCLAQTNFVDSLQEGEDVQETLSFKTPLGVYALEDSHSKGTGSKSKFINVLIGVVVAAAVLYILYRNSQKNKVNNSDYERIPLNPTQYGSTH